VLALVASGTTDIQKGKTSRYMPEQEPGSSYILRSTVGPRAFSR